MPKQYLAIHIKCIKMFFRKFEYGYFKRRNIKSES